ncbi:MAG: hypothetical protein IPM21_13920 [Acidobacteria bacterium]|nr:hypothetical protein [Acidobacteriota bacterium]
MSDFQKQGDCPSSHDLLAFQTGEMSVSDGGFIRVHLRSCDFCAAEAEFYEHYPISDDFHDQISSPEMPEPLFELAEAILSKKEPSRTLDRLIKEIDSVSL